MQLLKRKWISIALAVTLSLGMLVGVARALSTKEEYLKRIELVYDILEAYHKDKVDLEKFMMGAIRGGLETLGDPYTNYFTPQEYQEFMGSLNGSFSGIGAYLDQDGSYIVITAPIKNSPAERAGLQSGDRILEADGTPLVGATVEKAVKLIRGEAGTSVKLKIERPSESRTFTVTITREVVTIPEVEYKMLDAEVGYIQLTSFGDDAVREFYKAVDNLKKQGAKGLVFDLRKNPGGYLDAAVEIASAWIPKDKPVVWEVSRGEKEPRKSLGKLIHLPTVVLIDGGSASASEIVAGALQDYGAAKLVGTRSFGKGTVQTILDLEDGSGLKVTIAEYLTPKERHVQGVGLTPDVVVEQPKPSPERTAPMKFERFLTTGTVGLDVLYLQYRLKELGYDPDLDGFFGVKTKDAVLRFAEANWLKKEPVVDEKFIEVLNTRVTAHVAELKKDDVQLKKAIEVLKESLKK